MESAWAAPAADTARARCPCLTIPYEIGRSAIEVLGEPQFSLTAHIHGTPSRDRRLGGCHLSYAQRKPLPSPRPRRGILDGARRSVEGLGGIVLSPVPRPGHHPTSGHGEPADAGGDEGEGGKDG